MVTMRFLSRKYITIIVSSNKPFSISNAIRIILLGSSKYIDYSLAIFKRKESVRYNYY